MAIDSDIRKSADWMLGCVSAVNGVAFDNNSRSRVSVSLLHLCIEHQAAIHLLVHNDVIGSAFALMRPQFEAYLRGIWFQRCATDHQVADFIAGGQPPKVAALVEAVQKLGEYEEGTIGAVKEKIWKNLNDYTHGGCFQVNARNTIDEITSNYRPEDIAGLLRSAASLSLLAALAISNAVGSADLATKLLSLYQRTYEAPP